MLQLETTPGRTCIVDGKEYLFFSGYSYLGMNHVKEFVALVKEGIDKYAILFPSSRISNTRLNLYQIFEDHLSELLGTEETVTFSSGFLAGKTIADILSSYKNIFTAPGSHPAIKIENSLSNAESFNDWKFLVTEIINASVENEFILVSDSVNIMNAEIHNYSFLKNINEDKKIIFLVDDSHGIGIIGNNGEGIVSQLPQIKNTEFIISYSLSKAFNMNGGAISCSKHWAEKIRSHPNYSGSTAINPSLMHAFLKSQNIYNLQREKLFENIYFLKSNLPSSFLKKEFNLPIFICKDENAEELLLKKNIIISSFGYPFPDSKKINRVIINALHTQQDIQKICELG